MPLHRTTDNNLDCHMLDCGLSAIISPPPSIGPNSDIWSKKIQRRDAKAWSDEFCALHHFIQTSCAWTTKAEWYINAVAMLTA